MSWNEPACSLLLIMWGEMRFSCSKSDFTSWNAGSEPELLKWIVPSEIVHCRWTMLGLAGIFIPEPLTKAEILNTHHGSLQERLNISQILQHCLWWSLFSLHGLSEGDGLISWSLALSTLMQYSPTTSSLAQMLVTLGVYGLTALTGDQPHLRMSRILGRGR